MTGLLDRVELARALKRSPSAVDRLVQAKLLRSAGRRGRRAVFTLAAGKAALARAAAEQTPYTRALTSLLNAQAREARARNAELHTGVIHDDEWRAAWRAHSAAVRVVLDDWAKGAAKRILAFIADPMSPRPVPGSDGRAIGYAVQELEARPLLERIATAAATAPGRNVAATRPTPDAPAPNTIAEAKRALVDVRGRVAQLRADLKTDPGWRHRADVAWARDSAIAAARDRLWNGMPSIFARLTNSSADERSVQVELDAICAEVLGTLEEPLNVARGHRQEPRAATPRRRKPARRDRTQRRRR